MKKKKKDQQYRTLSRHSIDPHLLMVLIGPCHVEGFTSIPHQGGKKKKKKGKLEKQARSPT